MQEIVKGDPAVMDGLEKLSNDSFQHSSDSFGNSYLWYSLPDPDLILPAARLLYDAGARLAIICGYNQHQHDVRMHSACYEFVLKGVVYGVTVHMDEEHPHVPSITRLFANADWHEREMMELYGLAIKDHPNPRRLFLDEELDKGLLGEIVPLSIMMNGASSTDLWERILSDKGGRK